MYKTDDETIKQEIIARIGSLKYLNRSFIPDTDAENTGKINYFFITFIDYNSSVLTRTPFFCEFHVCGRSYVIVSEYELKFVQKIFLNFNFFSEV